MLKVCSGDDPHGDDAKSVEAPDRFSNPPNDDRKPVIVTTTSRTGRTG